jgi:hypothetical protein
MKTYKELERDAYMSGNVEVAKLYAKLIDAQHDLYIYEQLRDDDE